MLDGFLHSPLHGYYYSHRQTLGQPEVQVKNRLQVLRAERNWSQAKLASELGVSRQTVNAIENEKYDPSLPLAFKLSVLFKLAIEDIFDPETED